MVTAEPMVTIPLSEYERLRAQDVARDGGDSPDPEDEAIYHQLRLLTLRATTMEARLIPELLAGLETLDRLFGGAPPKPLKASRCTCGYCRAIAEAMNGSPFKRASTPR